jgi:CheY-like chemotaxis protein
MRILLIEGLPENVGAMESALADAGLHPNVHWAHSFEAAQRLLAGYADGPMNRLPHLIVLSPQLPDGSGLELLRNIRSSPSLAHLPVLIMSGDTQADQEQIAAEADFVEKRSQPIRWLPLVRRFDVRPDGDV